MEIYIIKDQFNVRINGTHAYMAVIIGHTDNRASGGNLTLELSNSETFIVLGNVRFGQTPYIFNFERGGQKNIEPIPLHARLQIGFVKNLL